MDTLRALTEELLANPTDDLVRYAIADYLEESNDMERVEFIRKQLADPTHVLRFGDLVFTRGFVSMVITTFDTWCKNHNSYTWLYPLERVHLTDKSPAHSISDAWYWEESGCDDAPRCVPKALLEQLQNYDYVSYRGRWPLQQWEQRFYSTEAAAYTAMELAVIPWTKEHLK